MSIIYILTNDSMPDYIKVGRTEREVHNRMIELDTTALRAQQLRGFRKSAQWPDVLALQRRNSQSGEDECLRIIS